MDIIECSKSEYEAAFPKPYHIYNSVPFNELNHLKTGSLKYLLFRSKKIRLGLIAALDDHHLRSPFSAPFGGFSFSEPDTGIEYLEESFRALNDFCSENKIQKCSITLPPLFYHEPFISKVVNAALRNGFASGPPDLDFAFFLEDFGSMYAEVILHRNARKNLAISLKKELNFTVFSSGTGIREAYEIISVNRAAKGFKLQMTLDQVQKTSEIIPADCFLVTSGSTPAASAIVFQVADRINQVIYWGDNPEWSPFKPMNFLSYKIFEYYSKTGLKVLDIGPSTNNGIPFYGVVEFKESIGSRAVLKFTIHKEFTD